VTTAEEEIARLQKGDAPSPRLQKKIDESEEFRAFVQHHLDLMGRLPSIERCKVDFPKFSEARIRSELNSAGFKLEQRGYAITTKNYLDPKKLAVANSLLNLADRRSKSQKLKDFGVSPAEFNNWKKDPVFNAYQRQRSEAMLGDSIPDVHLSLITSASNGDVGAMKLFYEITGRHGAQTQQETNIKAMLVALTEAVQEHVQDPDTLRKIATAMQNATGGLAQQVKGELA
jgi:hypothetical protein